MAVFSFFTNAARVFGRCLMQVWGRPFLIDCQGCDVTVAFSDVAEHHRLPACAAVLAATVDGHYLATIVNYLTRSLFRLLSTYRALRRSSERDWFGAARSFAVISEERTIRSKKSERSNFTLIRSTSLVSADR